MSAAAIANTVFQIQPHHQLQLFNGDGEEIQALPVASVGGRGQIDLTRVRVAEAIQGVMILWVGGNHGELRTFADWIAKYSCRNAQGPVQRPVPDTQQASYDCVHIAQGQPNRLTLECEDKGVTHVWMATTDGDFVNHFAANTRGSNTMSYWYDAREGQPRFVRGSVYHLFPSLIPSACFIHAITEATASVGIPSVLIALITEYVRNVLDIVIEYEAAERPQTSFAMVRVIP